MTETFLTFEQTGCTDKDELNDLFDAMFEVGAIDDFGINRSAKDELGGYVVWAEAMTEAEKAHYLQTCFLSCQNSWNY